jgi:uncharacterized repeat protein (TIGR01451 family)
MRVMNTKIFKKINILNSMDSRKRKLVFLVLSLMILSVLLVAMYFVFFTGEESDSTIISGTVYIDGTPAPEGLNISLVFLDGILWDEDGTNESGFYEIDVTDYIGESFEVHIEYGGNMYLGADEIGSIINRTVLENMSGLLDVFVLTIDDSDDDDSDDSDDTNSTGGDDDDDSTDESDDSDDGGDGSDDGDDGSDDTPSGDDDDDDGGSGDDDDDDGGSGDDDDPTDDPEEENESIYINVEKTIWNNLQANWNQEDVVEIGGSVQFNITVTYNGSNLSEIHVVDQLPDGLNYEGGALVNGSITEPFVDDLNNSLQWSISATSDQNVTFFIQYNASVLRRSTLQNNVSVNAICNDSSYINHQANATVMVYGDLEVSKTVKNSTDDQWFEEIAVDTGDMVLFNISVFYNGSYSLENLSVIDKLPLGINYLGNATINGVDAQPVLLDNNQTLVWNLTTIQAQETIFIEFDANITINETIQNTVNVKANESIGKQFNEIDPAKVTGVAPLKFICEKTVRVDNSSWQQSIHAYVGDNATFNVTVTNLEVNTVYNLAIIDNMPNTLKYVNGSSIIIFENQTYYKEPDYDEETNTYYWININEVIAGYFDPNDTIYLYYNVSVLDEGISQNRVQVNSSLCESCEPLTGWDSAIINASIPVPELSVEIVLPDNIYVDELITIRAVASGGEAPYSYSWDVNNDSVFGDENTSQFTIKWGEVGSYCITVNVTDDVNDTVIESVEVTVTIEPLVADAGGPYTAHTGESILFDGVANGGLGNYTWFWDFGDGNVSTIHYPTHAYANKGIFTVRLNVTDERNISAIDTVIVTITEPDSTPPVIDIESPINAIYLRGRPVFPFFKPLVFGPLEINITAEDDETEVTRIELYINNQLMQNRSDDSLIYEWDETVFGRQTLTIKAFNSAGYVEIEEKIVWKFL